MGKSKASQIKIKCVHCRQVDCVRIIEKIPVPDAAGRICADSLFLQPGSGAICVSGFTAARRFRLRLQRGRHRGTSRAPGTGTGWPRSRCLPRGRCCRPAPSPLRGQEPSRRFLRAQSQLPNARLEAAGSPPPGTGRRASGSLFGSRMEPLRVFPPVFLSPPRVIFVSLAANHQSVQSLGKHLRLPTGFGRTDSPLLDITHFLCFELHSPLRCRSASVGTGHGAKGPPGTLERSGARRTGGQPLAPAMLGKRRAGGDRRHLAATPTRLRPGKLPLCREPIASGRSAGHRRAARSPPGRKSISFTAINYPAVAAGATLPWGRDRAEAQPSPGFPPGNKACIGSAPISSTQFIHPTTNGDWKKPQTPKLKISSLGRSMGSF